MYAPSVNHDKLNSTSRDVAASLANAALFPIQDHQAHEQIAGVAILFAAFCHRLMLDPQEMHKKAMMMLRDQEFHVKGNIHIDVLRDFAGLRLTDKN